MLDVPDPTNKASKEPDCKRPERTPTISDYLRVFSYATTWDFCVYAIASLASIGSGVTLPLMNIIFGQLVNDFTDYFRASSSMPQDVFQGILNQQALYIMALFIGRWALTSINKFCFRMIGIRLSSAVRLDYLQSLFSQSIHVIDSMPAGAPATAITTTSNTLQLGISERLGTFLQFMATVISALVIAFVWNWQLTLVTSSLILYILVVLAVLLPTIVKGQTAIGRADTQGNAVASEALGGIRLVVACGAQSDIISRFEGWAHEARRRGLKVAPITSTQFGLVFFGIFGAFGLTFWYGTQRYIDGAISNPGVIIIVLMSVMMILTSLERISTPLIAVSNAMVAACDFFTVIDAPQPAVGSLKPDITSEDLIFKGVTFEYPSRPNVRVLDELNLCIQSGKNTALVGPSGSGKSTIVALVERWYSLSSQHVMPKVAQAKAPKESDDENLTELEEKPTMSVDPILSGSITVGGHNLEDLDLKWWRAQIGFVQQEPFLFNDTIFNNVANGLIGTEWADEREERKREMVQEACHEAYAHEFISRLPDGYDTLVGDGGAKLSGGQRQRLAIARSIIKKPRIMILDEATSAIDVKSEKVVQAALDRASQNRTTITIAHRLSTIQKADHIIVLKDGRAVEQGTHQSLLASSVGVYSALVWAQYLHVSSDKGKPVEPSPAFVGEAGQTADDPDQFGSTAHLGLVPQDTVKKPRSFAQSFGRIMYEQRSQWLSYLGLVVSSMAVSAGTPIQAWLFAKTLGVFLSGGDDLKRDGDFWGLMWFALAAGVGFSYFVQGWISMRAQYIIGSVSRVQYLTGMLHQKLAFFDKDSNSHGTLSSRIASDAKQLEELLGLNLAFLLAGIFTATGCIITSLIFGWKLGLVAMFVTMPIMVASGYWRYRHEVQFDKMNSAVFAESSQFATEAIGAIRTVSALTMEASIVSRYRQLLGGHVKAALRKAQWTAALYGFADSAGLGCQALVFWYGGRLLGSGEYTFEAFFVCFMAIIQGAESTSQALSIAPNAAQAVAAANRILDIQESTDRGRAGQSGDKGGIPDSAGGVQVDLRDVCFKYPTRDVVVFDGLNLSIKKGQFAAFVGPSGCGKTTIISLLERFYELDSDKGSIVCNGVNIKDLDVYEYRESLSLVAQEPTMFRGTVRDNILLGINGRGSTPDEKLHDVCRDAFIHDFIVSLPEGYDTDVGHKGVTMSGGQKQRIAIARALIRDPKILLLDEATSALDSESERSIQAALEKARKGRTMIAVAHRLSTIQGADVIFVFDNGRVVEKGSHSDLVRRRGVYWEIYQSQALDQ
ncbi:hypothetical protein ACHAPT_011978 [Fusarium lateritium]